MDSGTVSDFPEIPFGGGCPKCGKNDGFLYVNIKSEWFVCHEHRARWPWGRNLTSRWRDLDADELARQESVVRQYRTVEPVYSGEHMAEGWGHENADVLPFGNESDDPTNG